MTPKRNPICRTYHIPFLLHYCTSRLCITILFSHICQKGRERQGEIFQPMGHPWKTEAMRNNPSQGHGPGIPSRSPICMAGSQALRPSFTVSLGYPLAESWNEKQSSARNQAQSVAHPMTLDISKCMEPQDAWSFSQHDVCKAHWCISWSCSLFLLRSQ